MLRPATAAVPCPMTLIFVMLPSASLARNVDRQCAKPTDSATETVDLDDLAAYGLAEARRRLVDLLQQVVGRVAAIDVARGDLRP